MLNDAVCFKAVYIVCGYTDLRAGMDRLAALLEAQTGHRPYVPDTLYLFCGRRTDRIKGLVWEGDGWLLLYKRLCESRFQWPRNPEEVRLLTQQQFRWLMEGLTITPEKNRQTGGAAGIYGMILCKTENFSNGFGSLRTCAFRQYGVGSVGLKDGFSVWHADRPQKNTLQKPSCKSHLRAASEHGHYD